MEEVKKRIINLNKSLGLKTEFCDCGEGILGYSMKDTIYLNINIEQDLEKTNKHEILHFYEETEAFKKIKEEILRLNKDKLKKVYEEYELRYQGLYTKEEIENGIIDTEIVIDSLIDNYIIEYKQGLKVGNYVLGKIKEELEYKRYLNMTIKNSVENMKLTKWEKLFVMNYYDGKINKMPGQQDKYEQIRNDIKQEYERLCNLEKEEFRIYETSKEIEREYESEIKALQARGEDTTWLEQNKERALEELTNKFSEQLYEEYKHIVDYIRTTEYEEAFKVLMLRETLTKTYKIDKTEEKNNTIIKKRNMHNSISSHMILNDTVLKTIYENIDNYNNFANLYFAGLEIFNKKIIEKSEIKFDNVETYNKGKWIKFEGKTSNEEEYIKNSEELSSLVSDTPWCTKQLASAQLAEGDFYVFVDNENKPHIAVKMSGNEIDEVRGIANGNTQELEEEYRDIALSFLEENKEIKNGKEWLEKEEWNKRLVEYNEKIENNEITQEDIPNLINDVLYHKDYKSHCSKNANKEIIISKLDKIKDKIKGYYKETYGYNEEEVYIGNVNYLENQDKNISKYKIIFGNGNFFGIKDIDLSKLEIILGEANFKNSQVENLSNLKIIGKSADFENSKIGNLSSLEVIGDSANFGNSQIENLSNLKTIGENANFKNSQVENLSNLKTIGENANFENSKIENLSNLKTIGGYADFYDSQVKDLSSLKTIEGYADFCYSQVEDLSSLETIGGDAEFENSQVKDLSSLETIGGDAKFKNFQVKDLSSLKTIGGFASFVNSQVENLSNLKTIEDFVTFENSQVKDLSSLETIGDFADFENSQVENLRNLKIIGGFADFRNSQVEDLSSLKRVGGYANFYDSQVKDLSSLETIGDFADFENSQVENLRNLKIIGGYADFRFSQVKDLSSLETIGDFADFENSQVENLSNLKRVGGYAIFYDSQVKDLSNLKTIEGYAEFKNSKVQDLSSLEIIGGDANFENSQVKDLSSLETIGENAYFSNSEVQDLSSLKTIGGDVIFCNSLVKDLSSLKTIGGMVSFCYSQVEDISSLEKIEFGDDELFENSPLEGKYTIENGRVIHLVKDIDDVQNKII